MKNKTIVNILTIFLLIITISPVFAQHSDKVERMKARRAAAGTAKVGNGLSEALTLAKKGDINSWTLAKSKIASARDALKKMESSAATRDNKETKDYRATLNSKIKGVYAEADTWLPAKLTAKPVANKYTGSDKAKIQKAISTAWSKKWPTDKIKAIRFGNAQWKKTVKKNAAGVVIKNYQSLEVTVYVQESTHIATGYPAYYNIDNLKKTEVAGVTTKGAGFISKEVKASNF